MSETLTPAQQIIEAPPQIEPIPRSSNFSEAEKLLAYQIALSELPFDLQIRKMNAVQSPETLRRFLSAEAPDDLVARFAQRSSEVHPEDLTETERHRIFEIEIRVQSDLQRYLKLAAEGTVTETEISNLLIQIYQGRTKLHIAMGLIQEQNQDHQEAQNSYRSALQSGHPEGYSMLTNLHIQNEDLTSAYQTTKEALAEGYELPTLELAYHYLTMGGSYESLAKDLLRGIDPKDTRSPEVILLDKAIRTGHLDRILELVQFIGITQEEGDILIAAAHLHNNDIDNAINHFEYALQQQGCKTILAKLNKILTNSKNTPGLNLYNAQIFMADHIKFVIDGFGLNQLGNYLVNQTKN